MGCSRPYRHCQREHLAFLPIQVPAVIEQESSQSSQGVAGRFTPMHALMLLAPGHYQIIRLFGVGTSNALALGATLFVVGQVVTPVVQIRDELVQTFRIFGLGAIGVQERDGVISLASPEPDQGHLQQLGFGPPATADQIGQVVAFLAAMILVQNQFGARPSGEPLSKELGDPTCAVTQ
jgi:hypothetical protein